MGKEVISPEIYRNTKQRLEDVTQDLHFTQQSLRELKERNDELSKIIKEKDYEIMALKAKIFDITNNGWF